MANIQVPSTGSSQSQTSTQNPQAGAPSISSGAQTSSLQPEPASSLLNSQAGVTLSNGALPGVSLDSAAPATTATTAAPAAAPKHHVKPALLALPLVLIVLAAALMWFITRAEHRRSAV